MRVLSVLFCLSALLIVFLIPTNVIAISPIHEQTTVSANHSMLEQVQENGTNATFSSTTNATASWRAKVLSSPFPKTGCFKVTYPSTVWQSVPCGVAPPEPQAPSSAPLAIQPSTVGNTNDPVARSPPGTFIGQSVGSFQSVSGLTSETGTGAACGYDPNYAPIPDCYALQINSNKFTTWISGSPTPAWEQFIYSNTGGLTYTYAPGTTRAAIYIQFWLFGYATNNGGACPPDNPLLTTWWHHNGDCYANSASTFLSSTTASSLGTLAMSAEANYLGSGNDVVGICNSEGCYVQSITDNILFLSQSWTDSEFNVVGDAGGGQADFNVGTSIAVENTVKDQSGNPIKPQEPCPIAGTTGETNNLNLALCSSWVSGIVFSEGNVPQVTMTVSYSTPGGAGTSEAPKFFHTDERDFAPYMLTTTPTPVSVDIGGHWQVTPTTGTLACTSCDPSSERWQADPWALALAGTADIETLNFVFYHQFNETLSYSIVPAKDQGSPEPIVLVGPQLGKPATSQILTQTATGYWYDAGPWTLLNANPLAESTSSERWFEYVLDQPTSGTFSSAQTINFVYHHQFPLTISVDPSATYGNTWPEPGSYWEDYLSFNEISATPNSGYSFDHWSTSGASCSAALTNGRCGFDMPNNAVSVSATFTYTVTFQQYGIPSQDLWYVTVDGKQHQGSGLSVDVSGLSGTVSYSYYSPVMDDSAGYWVSYACVDTYYPEPHPCSGSVAGPTTVRAEYQLVTQTLTTGVSSGSGSVTPKVLSQVLDCSGGCTVAVGAPVVVTATADPGWAFSRPWSISGAECLGGNVWDFCDITMPNNPVSVYATFTYSVTFEQSGIPSGTWGVTVGAQPGAYYPGTGPSIVVSGLSGTESYSYDSPVSGATGTRYVCSTGCSGSVSGAATKSATYGAQYSVHYVASGCVLSVPVPGDEWVNSGAGATGNFPSVCPVSPTDTKCVFQNDNRPSSITGPTTVTGTYQTLYLVTYAVSPSGTGSTTPTNGWFNVGSQQTITATANINWVFSNWTVTCASSSGCLVLGSSITTNPNSVTVNGPGTITAKFMTPTQAVQSLGAQVQSLKLNVGNTNALTVKLNHALDKLKAGQTKAAVNELNAFINQVNAFVANGTLDAATGAQLVSQAQAIINAISSG